jgi:hypothetical protein
LRRSFAPGRAADPDKRHLELGQRVADLTQMVGRGLVRRGLLKQGQQGADRFDRQTHLDGVLLILGTGRQACAAHAEVDERDDVLQDEVLHPDLLDLLLVGGAKLLVGGPGSRASRSTAACSGLALT